MRASGERKFTRRGWVRSWTGSRQRHSAACCRRFCGKRLSCGGHRFPIFLTPKVSRESISGTIERTDARVRAATAAKRRFGARLWRGGGGIFARSVSRPPAESKSCHRRAPPPLKPRERERTSRRGRGKKIETGEGEPHGHRKK